DALEVVDARGRVVPGLYCLGPLLRGRYWEITAVPELRVAARWLAQALVERASAPPAVQSAPALQSQRSPSSSPRPGPGS
ncbi:hypothetical protein JYB64_25240, partial [Algoriphagus aestuarii]|nr:hypothetical protein [Algoriphagus aestuarii]